MIVALPTELLCTLYSERVETNVGRGFRNILTRKFSVQHEYHNIFNKNTFYSYIPNKGSIVKSYNAPILNPVKAQEN